MHRGVWHDSTPVAVKIQYPGAGPALISDLNQASRLGRLFSIVVPGLDVQPLLAELKTRVTEELDYQLEAEAQQAYAEAYADDPDILVPRLVMATDRVLVSEWMEGKPLSQVISGGSEEERDRAGQLLVRFLFSGPARAGLLHADPHPGNFRVLPDGRFGVLDFGAVNRLPDGLPAPIGVALRYALEEDADSVLAVLRDEGFVRPTIELDAAEVLEYLLPLIEPVGVEEFQFSRAWLRAQALRVGDPRSPTATLSRQLNLPPAYLLIHRVTLGAIGVLCQLQARTAYRQEMIDWLPGFADED